MFEAFKNRYRFKARPDGMTTKEYYAKVYQGYFKDEHQELGIYFRTLYHVFKFVDTSDLPRGSFVLAALEDRLELF